MSSVRPPPSSAERAVRAMSDLNRRITHDLAGDEMKMPFWRLHLPSGDIFTIRLIGVEGPLVRFTGFWTTASIVDYVLVAPEAVVVRIESSSELAEPLVIELPDDT